MQIVGRGFLARNLTEAFGDRYPHVTALAAGVSSTSVTAAAELDREADLLYETLRACRARRRTLLFFSTASFAMYGSTSTPAAETDPLYPPSVYGRHKLALEACVRSSTVDYLILRLSHLVGPHQRAHQILPGLSRQVRDGVVTLQRGAHRDLLDTEDLMRAIDGLCRRGVRAQVVNVVSGLPQPVESIVEGIERRLGMSARREHVASTATRTLASTRLLYELVPDLAHPGPGYLDRLLDRYVARASSQTAAAAATA
jgi:nucleoside-diphosphate-sugar epimerase